MLYQVLVLSSFPATLFTLVLSTGSRRGGLVQAVDEREANSLPNLADALLPPLQSRFGCAGEFIASFHSHFLYSVSRSSNPCTSTYERAREGAAPERYHRHSTRYCCSCLPVVWSSGGGRVFVELYFLVWETFGFMKRERKPYRLQQ